MKKVLLGLALTVGFMATANAHHMAANPDAGDSIPDWSPHLLMEF